MLRSQLSCGRALKRPLTVHSAPAFHSLHAGLKPPSHAKDMRTNPEWVCLRCGLESGKNLFCPHSEIVGQEPTLIWKLHGQICIAGWPCVWTNMSLWGTDATQHTEVKHFAALSIELKHYSQAAQPYEMSSPGNALKKTGWKHNQNPFCHPPPLRRKVSSYFINNTDSSVRYQITPAITGPVHRTSKLILFAFASQHRRLFRSREYTLELWLHTIGK